MAVKNRTPEENNMKPRGEVKKPDTDGGGTNGNWPHRRKIT